MRNDGGVPEPAPNAPEQPAAGLLDLSPVLLAALEQTRSPACITTADLDAPGPTIVYVNPAYCAMTGRARADVIGSSPRIMQGPLTDRAVLDQLRDALSSGQPFSGDTVNYRADGSPFLISWSIDPVRASGHEITHFVATQEDVTHQIRSSNLIEATQSLDRSLTDVLNSTHQRDAARQALVDAIGIGAAKIAPNGVITAVLIDDDDATHTTCGPPCEQKNTETPDAHDAGLSVRVDFAQAVSQSRGWILVHGLSASQRAFVDVEGLDRYAERVAIVGGTLFEYQRQRDAAIRLQRSLLPPAELAVPGFDIVAEYLPGSAGLEVGGDWYDATIHDDVVTISVGDVSGSGVDAAALMGRLRLLAAHELNRGSAVPDVLTVLDRLCREESQMATMLLAQINMSSGEAELWSAGHLPPVCFDADQTSLRYFDVAPPLGFLGATVVRSERLHIDPGHGLFLFTDGLVERRTEVITEGLERLCVALDPSQPLEAMVRSAREAAGDQVADDVAIVAVRRDR